MSQKPTSLAAHLKRQDDAEKIAQETEDAEVAQRPSIKGKIWVRLLRPHYDKYGVLHEIGVVALDANAVPSSAKVLSQREADSIGVDCFARAGANLPLLCDALESHRFNACV